MTLNIITILIIVWTFGFITGINLTRIRKERTQRRDAA